MGSLDLGGTGLLLNAELSTSSVLPLNSRGEMRQDLLLPSMMSPTAADAAGVSIVHGLQRPGPGPGSPPAPPPSSPSPPRKSSSEHEHRHSSTQQDEQQQRRGSKAAAARALARQEDAKMRSYIGVHTDTSSSTTMSTMIDAASVTPISSPHDGEDKMLGRRGSAGLEAEAAEAEAAAVRAMRAELPQRLYRRRCVVPGPSRGFAVVGLGTGYINL
eukprot:COSAG06_NODE_1015_length_11065_cov_5.743936_3_plen_216_part_00